MDNLSGEAKTLVVKASKTEHGVIMVGETFGGWDAGAGEWSTGQLKGRAAALWKDSIDMLIEKGCLRVVSLEMLELTTKGWKLADSLNEEENEKGV